MVQHKKKLPTKSPRVAVTAAPPSAGNQSLGSVSRSTRSQQRLQNEDTASLLASARTVPIAIANGEAKTSGMSTPTKKKWKCGYKKSKSPKTKKKANTTKRSK